MLLVAFKHLCISRCASFSFYKFHFCCGQLCWQGFPLFFFFDPTVWRWEKQKKKKSQLTASSRLAFLINIIIICLSNYAGRKSIKTYKKVRFRVSVWIRATIYSWSEANSMFYTHVYINNNNQKKKKKVGPFALLYQFFFFLLPAGNCSKKRCRANSSRYTKTEGCPRSELHKYSDDLCFLFLSCFFHFYFWGLEDHCSVLAPFALFGIDVSLFLFLFFLVFFSFRNYWRWTLFPVFFFFWLPSIDSVWRGRDRASWRWWSLTSEHDRRFAIEAQKKKKKEKRVRLVIYEGCRNTYASKKKKNNIFWFSVFFCFTSSFFVSLALSLLLLSSFFSPLER